MGDGFPTVGAESVGKFGVGSPRRGAVGRRALGWQGGCSSVGCREDATPRRILEMVTRKEILARKGNA